MITVFVVFVSLAFVTLVGGGIASKKFKNYEEE